MGGNKIMDKTKIHYTWLDVAREYFPDYSDAELDHIIWAYTGFPEFWHIPEDGNTVEECFRKQLQDFKDGKVIDADL
jgi:hypothetical protein